MADTVLAAPQTPAPEEADLAALGGCAKALAERLGETALGPRQQLWRIVQAFGVASSEAMAEEAEDVWTGAGMLTLKGDRQRSLGGVFFALAKRRATEAQRHIMYPEEWLLARRQRWEAKQARPSVPLPDLARFAQKMKGAPVSTVSLKLIGHPGTVQMRGGTAFFVLTSEKAPTLPKGLPAVASGTRFLVVVGERQWKKVAELLRADPETRLMIEGYPTLVKDFQGIAVAALNCVILPKKAPKPEAAELLRPDDSRTEVKS